MTLRHGWMMVMGDLHGRTPDIWRPVDAILLAGDLCPELPPEGQAAWLDGPFRRWLERQTVPVVAVAGNHDRVFERPELVPKNLPWTYLLDSETTVNGLRVWGAPWYLGGQMAFGLKNEREADKHFSLIPEGIDIVLTHNPPMGFGDRPTNSHIGSYSLLYHVARARAQLHLFGHVHEGRGHWRAGPTYFINCTLGAGCGRNSWPGPAPHPPWGLADESWRRRGST